MSDAYDRKLAKRCKHVFKSTRIRKMSEYLSTSALVTRNLKGTDNLDSTKTMIMFIHHKNLKIFDMFVTAYIFLNNWSFKTVVNAIQIVHYEDSQS